MKTLPRRGWLIVFLAAAAVRLPLWVNLSSDPALLQKPDSGSYVRPAKNLVQHGVYSDSEVPPFTPDATRPPGYPLFLSAHFLVSNSLRWPALTQVLIEAGTAALIAAAAASVTAHPAAWAAGLLYALDPLPAAQAPLLLTEPLFGLWLTLAALLLLRAGEGARALVMNGLAGLSLGAATLVKPVSMYLWLPWSAALAWARPQAKRQAAAFALGALLLPALWCARNWTVWGKFEYNPVRSADLLSWQAASIQAAIRGTTRDAAHAELIADFEKAHPGLEAHTEEAARLLETESKRIILSHPWQMIKLFPVSLVKMMLGPGLELVAEAMWPGQALPNPNQESAVYKVAGVGTLAVLRARPLLWVVGLWEALLLACGYGFAGLGTWRLWKANRRLALAACLLPLLYLILISNGGWTYYRMRIPMLPLVAILAAAAL